MTTPRFSDREIVYAKTGILYPLETALTYGVEPNDRYDLERRFPGLRVILDRLEALERLVVATVDDPRCPRGGGSSCRCGKCSRCGNHEHTNTHGSFYPDNKPPGYGHAFERQPEHQ